MKRILFLKIGIIIIMIGVLIYLITIFLIAVRNEGGNEKAIFWVILAAIALFENFILFLPFICFIKTIILLTYGAFYPKKFYCSLKMVTTKLLITDSDRALFKELAQIIKNNTQQSEKLEIEENIINLPSEKSLEEIPSIAGSINNNTQQSKNNFNILESEENKNNGNILDPAKIFVAVNPRQYEYKDNSEEKKYLMKSPSQSRSSAPAIPEYLEHHEFEKDESFSLDDKFNILADTPDKNSKN